jgi:ribosomal protein S18 acetylase RimI-like enzyme
MRVMPATPADADAIARISVRGWQAAYRGLMAADFLAGLSLERRSATWRHAIELGRDRILVSRDGDGAVLGFSCCAPARDDDTPPRTAELMALYLDPAAWRQGHGRQLWQAAHDDMRARQFKAMTVWVLSGNARAVAFYQAVGFKLEPGRLKTLIVGGAPIEEQRLQQPLA